MPRVLTGVVALGLASVIVPLLRGQEAPVTRYAISAAPEALRPAIERGDEIFGRMKESLIKELSKAIRAGGPAGAVDTCHQSAAAIVEQVKREQGFPLGRTSDRLRNPTNVAPPWAAAVVKQYADANAAAVEGFAFDLGDRVGVLRPLAQMPVCASCHGSAARLSAGVKRVLAERYPADRAVNFREGQVRGWFWAEIPR
jgi:hypothetical protein